MDYPESDPSRSESELNDPRRQGIITDFVRACGHSEGNAPLGPLQLILPPAVLTFLWVADIECLERFARGGRSEILEVDNEIRKSRILLAWAGKNRSINTSPKSSSASSSELPPSKKRKYEPSSSSASLAECRRDVNIPQLVHACDHRLVGYERKIFWSVLSQFWVEEKVNSWKSIIEKESTESSRNGILLAPHAHQYWDQQLFALEPLSVSEDEKVLNMRFHWLCPGNLTRLDLEASDFFEGLGSENIQGPNLRPVHDLTKGKGENDDMGVEPNIRLLNCESGNIISGFQITTDNPITHSLPSLEIFQLQWLLHRVRALAVAAGYQDFPEDDDDGGATDDEGAADERRISFDSDC